MSVLSRRFLVVPLPQLVILLLFLPVLFTGCAVHQGSMATGNGTYRVLPEKYTNKALDYEARGMFFEAMQSWQIVLYFQPDNMKIKAKIEALKKNSLARAGEHFIKGVNLFRDGRLDGARKEFLLTLVYDRDHKQALEYLQNKLQPPIFKTYHVQAGDTLRQVAEREYHDPNKEILILAFNDIPHPKELPPGSLLQIPLLGKDFLSKGSVQAMRQYDAVLPQPSKESNNSARTTAILKKPSQHIAQAADDKINDAPGDLANYQKAKEFFEQKKYRESKQILLALDSNFRDVRQLKASIDVVLQQEADIHYRKGISYFLSEELEKAIVEWEEALRLKPTHLRAKKDLKNARKMLQKVGKY